VKHIVRNVRLDECRRLVDDIMKMVVAEEIEAFVREYLVRRFPDEFQAGI